MTTYGPGETATGQGKRPSAVTPEHAKQRHGVVGEGWQEEHRKDHEEARWAHFHRPQDLEWPHA